MAETILSRDVYEQYHLDMQRYAIYVNRKRVSPDSRDGLKSIHRKILYCMWNDIKCINHTVKSANVVGQVLAKYSPHGDAATYGAIKPMANWFEIYMPLIVPQGQFGSFQGDKAAAPRYTEVKLSKFAYDCVINDMKVDKNVVDWVPNYDDSTVEPEYLPVAVPLLLINGVFGVGVGMKTEIPSHNINEVIDVTLKLMDDPNADFVLVPDQCMPCEIVDADFRSIGEKGIGSYKVRGIIDIEQYEGKPALVIKSMPSLIFLDSIEAKINKLIETKKLIQIDKVVPESTVDEMRYVIVLKKGSDPNFVRDVIYKNTDMEKSERINFEVLQGIDLRRMSYREYLLTFIDFRKLAKFRLYCNKLQRVKTDMHETEAYIKVLESGEIDKIIDKIRKRTNTDDNELMEYLIKLLDITDLQAKFIMNANLKKLSIGYLNHYKARAATLQQEYDICMHKILYEEALVEEIKQELLEYKKMYGCPRRSKIVSAQEESAIPAGEFKVVITENNFIKKMQVNESIGSFKNDAPKKVIKVDNTDNILLFDEKGKVYKLPVHKIPFTDRNSNGIDVRMLVKGLTANILTVMYESIIKRFSDRSNKYYMIAVTEGGNIKRMDLKDFLTVPASGIIYMKTDDDIVKDVIIANEGTDILVYSDKKALRMPCSEVPHYKRNTKGSKAMQTSSKIDGISIITKNTTDIVVITEKGYVNRLNTVAMPKGQRADRGSNVIKLAKGDAIHSMYGLNEKDTIVVVTKNGKMDIPVGTIPMGSSISGGSKLIPLKGDMILRCDIIKG